jgi:ABC-type polysaccharide/polyol phosphate export permease
MSPVVPREWRLAYSLNPMVRVIDGFRLCLLRGAASGAVEVSQCVLSQKEGKVCATEFQIPD